MTRADAYVLFDAEDPEIRGTTRESAKFYFEHKDEFWPFVEAWVFNPGTAEAVVTGFFRRSTETPFHPSSTELPRLRRAGVVLIDERGNQMWLVGAGSSGGTTRGGAIDILNDAGFDLGPDGLGLVTHYVDRIPAPDPFHPRANNKLLSLDGELSISSNGAAVKCFESERSEDQSKLLDWWASATGPASWLEDIVSLTLYLNPRVSEVQGHYGYQLIAVGSTGREAWIHLPGPVITDSMTSEYQRQQMQRFEPIRTNLDHAVEQIFDMAGFHITLKDNRPWLLRKLSPMERPAIINRRK